MPRKFHQNWNLELQPHEAEWMQLTETIVTAGDWNRAVREIFKIMEDVLCPSGRVSLFVATEPSDDYFVIGSTDQRFTPEAGIRIGAEQMERLMQSAKADDFGIFSVPNRTIHEITNGNDRAGNFFLPAYHVTGTLKALMIPFYTAERLSGVLLLECSSGDAFSKAFKTRIILVRNLLKLTVPKFNPLQQDPDRLQKILISADKMASLGQLISGVAHELNNPVSFIESNVGFLEKYLKEILQLIAVYEKELPADSPAYQSAERYKEAIEYEFALRDLDNIVKSFHEGAYRIKSIVTSLSAFSRADRKVMEEINAHEAMDNTINLLMHKARHNVIFEKDYRARPYLVANRSEINQVFMNILINAVQAIQHKIGDHDKGTVRIATWSDEKYFYVSVNDNGEGIAPQHLEKIFEPFFTTKQFGEGTGLGLSISRDIIERHQGSIRAECRPEEGTTFTISIPHHLDE